MSVLILSAPSVCFMIKESAQSISLRSGCDIILALIALLFYGLTVHVTRPNWADFLFQ